MGLTARIHPSQRMWILDMDPTNNHLISDNDVCCYCTSFCNFATLKWDRFDSNNWIASGLDEPKYHAKQCLNFEIHPELRSCRAVVKVSLSPLKKVSNKCNVPPWVITKSCTTPQWSIFHTVLQEVHHSRDWWFSQDLLIGYKSNHTKRFIWLPLWNSYIKWPLAASTH